MTATTILLVLGALALVAAITWLLVTPTRYPTKDLAAIDRGALFRQGEELLVESAPWPIQRSDGSVLVSSAVGPFEVRAVRYEVDVDTDFEAAVAYVKDLSYCGPKSRHSKDKFEETLYEKNEGRSDHEWVRRSVHISPPPGSNRDAVVVYYEDRPAPRRYRIAFRSVDSIDGEPLPPHEGASRFVVNPAIYEVEETAAHHVRIIKVEAVDPRGRVGPLLNNYFVSLLFFRSYMFDEAKAMRDHLATLPQSG